MRHETQDSPHNKEFWYGLCYEIHSLEEIIFHSDQAFITKEGQLKKLEHHFQVNIFLTPKRCYELTHG